jgi:putative endonuclease
MEITTSERGASAEAVAAEALVEAGYDIVEQNWTCDAGELDIIARHGDILVFVEVRSRADGTHGHAAEMVSPAKQRQVTRLAEIYLLLRRPEYEQCRFDVVAITGSSLEIIQDAWRVRG